VHLAFAAQAALAGDHPPRVSAQVGGSAGRAAQLAFGQRGLQGEEIAAFSGADGAAFALQLHGVDAEHGWAVLHLAQRLAQVADALGARVHCPRLALHEGNAVRRHAARLLWH
jgi:hypothetical protein